MPAESTTNFSTTSGYTTDGHTCSSDINIGCWYNYYSATAGTISSSSNATPASSDICPSGWHLPTGPNTTSGTDFNKLIGNTTSGNQASTTGGLPYFNGVTGGYINDGTAVGTTTGGWWSANYAQATSRFLLTYNSSTFNGGSYATRVYGYFVRCVKSS